MKNSDRHQAVDHIIGDIEQVHEQCKVKKKGIQIAVAIAKENAYEYLYQKLVSREGKYVIYKLAITRNRTTNDISDTIYISDADGIFSRCLHFAHYLLSIISPCPPQHAYIFSCVPFPLLLLPNGPTFYFVDKGRFYSRLVPVVFLLCWYVPVAHHASCFPPRYPRNCYYGVFIFICSSVVIKQCVNILGKLSMSSRLCPECR